MFPPWLHLRAKCWIWGDGALFGIGSRHMIDEVLERIFPVLFWLAEQVAVDAEVEDIIRTDCMFCRESEFRRGDVLDRRARDLRVIYFRGDTNIGVGLIPEIRWRWRDLDDRGRAEHNYQKIVDGHRATALVLYAGDNQFAVELGWSPRLGTLKFNSGSNLSHCEASTARS